MNFLTTGFLDAIYFTLPGWSFLLANKLFRFWGTSALECLLSLAGNNPLAHVRRQAHDRLAFIRELLLGGLPSCICPQKKQRCWKVQHKSAEWFKCGKLPGWRAWEFYRYPNYAELVQPIILGIPVGLVRPVGMLQNQSATDCIALCSRSCGGRYAGGWCGWEIRVLYNLSGQIIETSHDLGPQQFAEEGNPPLFQGNLGRWKRLCTNFLNHYSLAYGNDPPHPN